MRERESYCILLGARLIAPLPSQVKHLDVGREPGKLQRVVKRIHLPMLGQAGEAVAQPVGDAIHAPPSGQLPSVLPSELVDPQARTVRYLRVSVTDRCNYRCVYCMPADAHFDFRERDELLTFEEIVRVATVFAGFGVRKLRLTGGEPTVRAHLVDLVAMLAKVPGLEQIVMTSNGHLLGKLAAPLAAAGLSGINISIDSVDAKRFRELTGRGDVVRVIEGIDAAIAAGLTVKLNAVAVADGAAADDDVAGLCDLAWSRGIPLRFIEPMPMSSAQFFDKTRSRTSASIRQGLEKWLGKTLVPVTRAEQDAGPARYWQVDGDPCRQLGIISAMSDHFCDDCNRLRLTATGELHACLGHDDAVNLRDVMRNGGDDAALGRAIAYSVGGKRVGHEFQSSGAGAPAKHMITMGG